MMKKILLFIILDFSISVSHAQLYNVANVEYDYIYNVGDKEFKLKSILTCSNSQSVFQYIETKNERNKAEIIGDQQLSVNLKSLDAYYVFDLSKRSFFLLRILMVNSSKSMRECRS